MEKIYVVVYVCVMTFSGDIYTEQKITRNKSVARKYFKDYIVDIAKRTNVFEMVSNFFGDDVILEESYGSVFDYDGANGGNMYHVEISEVYVAK